MATKPLKVLPISAEQFKKFQEQKLLRMIDEAATALEKKFSALCEEFNQKFNADQWILMTRKNQQPEVYYIHAIAGVMPDLSKFGCAYNAEYNNYTVSPASWKFANFQGDLPSEAEMNRCFNDKLHYFRDSTFIHCVNDNYRGMTFKGNNQFWYKYLYNNRFKGTVKLHGNRTDSDNMISIPIYRFNGINSAKLPAASALLFWLEYELEPLQEQFNNKAGREAFKALQKLYSQHGEFLLGTEAGISLDRQKSFAGGTGWN